MRLLQFIPIKLSLFLMMGIIVGYLLKASLVFPILLTIIFLLGLCFPFVRDKGKNPSLFGIMAMGLVFCIGMMAISLTFPKNIPNHYTKQKVRDIQIWQVKIQEVLKANSFSRQYIAKVRELDHKRVTGDILLRFPMDSLLSRFQVDDELILLGDAKEISPPLNPYQFNYRKYMGNRGVLHQINTPFNGVVVLKNPRRTLRGHAAMVRSQIIKNLKKHPFGKKELGVMQALLLGQRSDIPEATYDTYKKAGAVHILAVSGLHVGILLLLVQWLLKPLSRVRHGKNIQLVITVLCLWGFAFIAGLSPSVVRAVTMFSFMAWALYLKRPGNTFNFVALSILFILLVIDPRMLFQVGFQMSYAAVLAIIWIYPLLQKWWQPKNWVLGKGWQLLSVSIAAQLGVLPLGLFYFHQFPALFFISNLLIVPFLGLILGMGILVILLASLDVLPHFLVQTYNGILATMNHLVGWVAGQETFLFSDIPFDQGQLLLLFFIIISLVIVLENPRFNKLAVLCAAVLGFQGYTLYTNIRTSAKNEMVVFHRIKHTVLGQKKGRHLALFTNDTALGKAVTTNYMIGERIVSWDFHPLRNTYILNGKRILIVDSLGVYPTGHFDIVLLTQSPKVNLDRLLDTLQPKMIISDGSNYHSYISRWKSTCSRKKIPFHHTGERGVFYFSVQKKLMNLAH
ncbi:MAG: ComEC/Rec2 family competence protein [Flavobacteriaceae bacterium]